jgi:hypothetical protein
VFARSRQATLRILRVRIGFACIACEIDRDSKDTEGGVAIRTAEHFFELLGREGDRFVTGFAEAQQTTRNWRPCVLQPSWQRLSIYVIKGHRQINPHL